MKIDKYLEDRLGILDCGKNPARDSNNIRQTVDAGFNVLVTIADYDFNISWRVGSPVSIRHYQCTFGDYPRPTEWELQHLNEFFLYEFSHDRRVALWGEDTRVRDSVLGSIEHLFRLNGMTLTEIVKSKLESQSKRASNIPERLTHCKACAQSSCITKMLCHVSSIEDAESILKTGEILSATRSRHRSGEELALEKRNAAGDPPDYFEYVMFTFANCTAGDRLVMERSLGRSPTQEELTGQFRPGVRFYFKYSDLVRHPRFRSDGYHYCKIKDSLSLDDYLVAVVAPDSARPVLENAAGREFVNKLVFVDQNKFADLLSWSQYAYNVAVRHKGNKI